MQRRTIEVDPTKNDEALKINLDLIEKKREQAAIQEAKRKTKMEKYYNFRVRGPSFKPGEWLLRSKTASPQGWRQSGTQMVKGTYEVAESLENRAYYLKDFKGN
ncbi:hypothetical protein Tco_0889418 [Tanacetum coccineum]